MKVVETIRKESMQIWKVRRNKDLVQSLSIVISSVLLRRSTQTAFPLTLSTCQTDGSKDSKPGIMRYTKPYAVGTMLLTL